MLGPTDWIPADQLKRMGRRVRMRCVGLGIGRGVTVEQEWSWIRRLARRRKMKGPTIVDGDRSLSPCEIFGIFH